MTSLGRAFDARRGPIPNPRPSRSPERRKERLRVLIADDSPFARSCLRELIVDAGFEVVGEVASAAEAVHVYASLRPDAVTMDLNMPGLSGLEAIFAIRAIDPGCRIVLITAVRADPIVSGLRTMGIPVAHKPVGGPELAELLQRDAPGE